MPTPTREQLASIEWCVDGWECPACGWTSDEGHEEHCWLARLSLGTASGPTVAPAVPERIIGTGSWAMALSREDVREQLRATVDGRISVEQLEDWLVANSWNLHQTDAATEVQELVWSVDHELATRSTDAAAVDALRRVLQQLDAPRLTITGVLPTPSSCTASFGSARTLLHIVSGSARVALESGQPEAAS